MRGTVPDARWGRNTDEASPNGAEMFATCAAVPRAPVGGGVRFRRLASGGGDTSRSGNGRSPHGSRNGLDHLLGGIKTRHDEGPPPRARLRSAPPSKNERHIPRPYLVSQ